MKIEKINENQIRCTLTREDLELRHLKVSELAYGTEKTQNLFREMIQEADFEYGFDTDDFPLMIEAIPMHKGSIVLVITKVDDPDELDTRFSRFAPSIGQWSSEDEMDFLGDFQDEVQGLLGEASEEVEDVPLGSRPFEDVLREATDEETERSIFLFTMRSVATAMNLAGVSGGFRGESALYKDEKTGQYLLAVRRGAEDADAFRSFIRMATEFGTGRRIPEAGAGFLREHCDALIAEDAIGKLRGPGVESMGERKSPGAAGRG